MNEKDLFIKVPVELLPLRLPRTLLLLYGRILLHAADGKGKCFTAHSKLAEEIGVSLRQINYHVQTLKRLRLIESTRGSHHDPNSYRELKPDVQWIAHQICNALHISDMQPIAHIKEPIGVLKEVLKEGTHPPTPQRPPSPKPDRKTDECATDVARGVRAPISRKGVVSENAAATGLFQEFIGVFLAAGKSLNDRDVERARKLWLKFDAPEHGRILEHLKRSVTDGTWSDALHTPMPDNYLRSKAWTRVGPGRVLPLPPKSESKAENAQRPAAERFLRGER